LLFYQAKHIKRPVGIALQPFHTNSTTKAGFNIPLLVPAPFHTSLVCKLQSENPVVVFFISFIRLEIKEIIIYIVLQVAWEFYIGGYQPAQKWLKDR